MRAVGIRTEGLKTVGDIAATNTLTFGAQQKGLAIAEELLSTHATGAPFVDAKGKYIGFINEFDVIKALEAGKDLDKLVAEDLMRLGPIAVHEFTTIGDAARRMEERCVLNLPVEKEGKVTYSVNRHDLLRTWIGLFRTGLDR